MFKTFQLPRKGLHFATRFISKTQVHWRGVGATLTIKHTLSKEIGSTTIRENNLTKKKLVGRTIMTMMDGGGCCHEL
jgi:hypothetical protein